VTLGTLRDTGELLRLLSQICEISPIAGLTDCEADQLWFVSAAELALRYANNPVAYWRTLISRNSRNAPKVVDEDTARARLRKHFEFEFELEGAACLS
jgi:hypothetical protein